MAGGIGVRVSSAKWGVMEDARASITCVRGRSMWRYRPNATRRHHLPGGYRSRDVLVGLQRLCLVAVAVVARLTSADTRCMSSLITRLDVQVRRLPDWLLPAFKPALL